MRTLLTKQVSAFWLLLLAILLPSAGIVWKLAVMDAPPANSVLISDAPNDTPATARQTPTTSSRPAQPTIASQATTPNATPLSASVLGLAAAGAAATPDSGLSPTATRELIEVYVSGAVLKAGVYTLPLGSRVGDAVSAAGGAIENADMEGVNLAAHLSDEEHVSVPRQGDTPVPAAIGSPQPGALASRQPGGQSAQPKPLPTGKVNINSASSEQLQTLPGVGPVLAQRIITYRTENGPFQSVEEIMRVPGIKAALFSKIRDHIKVGP